MKYVVRGVVVGRKTPSDIIVENGKVVSVRSAGKGQADVGSRTAVIGPTLFDIQVNGVGGVSLQTATVRPEDVRTITDTLANWGISHWIPTLVTSALKDMERGCRVIAAALQDKTVARAVPGIHLEGPYISPEDGPRGAHPKHHVRKPSLREFDRLLKAADGKVIYTTVAPELEGTIPYIKGLVKRGVVVSLGHHNATEAQIRKAVDAGARLCTHLGNGLSSRIPRHVNPLWPQLAEDRLAASFIPDLHHLPPNVLKTFVRAKGPEKVILISDCVHVALLKPGRYELFESPVELKASGRVCLSGTDYLAGSAVMLLQGLVNAARVTDLTLEQAFASATTIPAKVLGLNRRFALPRPSRKADFVIFDLTPSSQVRIHGVFIRGTRIR